MLVNTLTVIMKLTTKQTSTKEGQVRGIGKHVLLSEVALKHAEGTRSSVVILGSNADQ